MVVMLERLIMFNIGDRVNVTIITGLHNGEWKGTVKDVETVQQKFTTDSTVLIETGRYGVDLDVNPFAIDLPYFFAKELTLIEN